MGTRKSFIKFTPLLVILFAIVFVFPYSASALDISQSVTYVKGYFYPYWSDNNGKTYSTGGYQYSTNGDYTSSNIQYFRTSSNSALTASTGQYVSLTGSIVISVTSQSQAVSIQANPRQYFSISSSNTDCQIIDLQYDDQQYQTQGTTWLLRYSFSSVCRMKSNVSNNVAMNFNLNGGSTSGTDYLNFIPQYIGVWNAADGFDDTAIINAITGLSNKLTTINNTLNSVNTSLGLTNDKLDDMLDGISNLNTLQQQANEDEQDRYEQEKQEEADREQQGQEASNDLAGAFNFSVLNPFSPIFNMFSSSCSVSIPTIASWINAPSSTYSSWWCGTAKLQSIRNVLSSVFAFSAMILIFGFVMNWLRNDTSTVTVEYKDNG